MQVVLCRWQRSENDWRSMMGTKRFDSLMPAASNIGFLRLSRGFQRRRRQRMTGIGQFLATSHMRRKHKTSNQKDYLLLSSLA